MTHREITNGHRNRRPAPRAIRRTSRLGQGLEQIEPRIMLAGESVAAVPAITVTPIEFASTRTVQGGYVNLSSVYWNSDALNSGHTLSGDGLFHASGFDLLEFGSADSHVVLASIPRASARQVWLQQPVIVPATEGGFALIQLGPSVPSAPGANTPGTRDAIATGVAAPLTPAGRSTLGSDAPLEAARGRSQAFELSMNLQESTRSAAIVNATAVDAAIAQWNQQPSQAKPHVATTTEAGPQASVDELLAAARQVEARLSAIKPVAVESAVAWPATSESATLSYARDLDAVDESPADSLLAAESSPTADADLVRRSLLTSLLAFDKSHLIDMPGVWLFTAVVSLTGLYWQKSGIASHRWPARENEAPEPRLRRMAVAGRRAG